MTQETDQPTENALSSQTLQALPAEAYVNVVIHETMINGYHTVSFTGTAEQIKAAQRIYYAKEPPTADTAGEPPARSTTSSLL